MEVLSIPPAPPLFFLGFFFFFILSASHRVLPSCTLKPPAAAGGEQPAAQQTGSRGRGKVQRTLGDGRDAARGVSHGGWRGLAHGGRYPPPRRVPRTHRRKQKRRRGARGRGWESPKGRKSVSSREKSPARSGTGTAPVTVLGAPPRRALGGTGGSRAARAGRCAGRAPTSGRRAHIDAGARPRSPRSRRKQDGGTVGAGSAAPGLCVLDVGEAEGRGRGQSGIPAPAAFPARHRRDVSRGSAAPRRRGSARRGRAVGPPTWLIDRGGGGAAAAPSPRGRTQASPRRPSPRLCLRTGDGGRRRPGFVPLPGPGRTQRRAQPGERGERRGARGAGEGEGAASGERCRGLGREKCVRARRGLGARPPVFRAMVHTRVSPALLNPAVGAQCGHGMKRRVTLRSVFPL